MPFVTHRFHVDEPLKAFLFLIREFGISQKEAQKWIDRERVLVGGEPMVHKAGMVAGEVSVYAFCSEFRSLLQPLFMTPDFAIYNKPSGMLVHPSKRSSTDTLLDSARHLLGPESNITHRIDRETSGLLLVSRHKRSEQEIKRLFEERHIQKGYLALIRGRLEGDRVIEAALKKSDSDQEVRLKMAVDSRGKPSTTIVRVLRFISHLNATLVEARPLTGRQHQIRVHLWHIGHPIIGDPIYGVSFEQAAAYLDGVMSAEDRRASTGAPRLMLHATSLQFSLGCRYAISCHDSFLKELENL